jgi:hypothetical protein
MPDREDPRVADVLEFLRANDPVRNNDEYPIAIKHNAQLLLEKLDARAEGFTLRGEAAEQFLRDMAARDASPPDPERERFLEECHQIYLRTRPDPVVSDVSKLDGHHPGECRCYLVAHMTTKPPCIVGTGLYSESAASLSGAIGPGRFAFDVAHGDGPTYESARRRLLEIPEPWRQVYQWALDMLPEGA